MKTIKDLLLNLDSTIKITDAQVMSNPYIEDLDYFKWYFLLGLTFKPKKFAFIGFDQGLETIAFVRGLEECKIAIKELTFFGFDFMDKDKTRFELSELGLENNLYSIEQLKNPSFNPITLDVDLFFNNLILETPFKMIKLYNLIWKNLKPGGWLIINNLNNSTVKTAVHTFLIKLGAKASFIDSLKGLVLVKK